MFSVIAEMLTCK